MELHRLRLRNFRQHEATDLVLGRGLTGIIGANGAGKSTLLEAIAWALYGMTAARGTRESIRRRGAPARSRVEVELEFSLGAHHFRVVRTLADASLFQDHSEAPIATSLGGVTDRLTRLLGMTRDEFFNTYFTGQKELAIMASMKAPDRAQFLGRVLGFERLRLGQDRLREARQGLKARLGGLEEGLPDEARLATDLAQAAERLAAALAQFGRATADRERTSVVLSAVRPRWEELQLLQERVRSVTSDLRIAEKDVGQARQAIEQLDRDLAETMTARDRLAELTSRIEPLAALRGERDQLDEAARRLARRREALGQAAELSRGIEAVTRQLAVLPPAAATGAARAELDSLRATLAEAARAAREARTAWVRDSQDATTRRQHLLDQFGDLRKQRDRLVELGPDGACPTCSRVLGSEFAAVVGVVERQMAEVETNGRYFRQRIEQLRKEPPELLALEAERKRLEEQVSALTGRVAELETQSRERAGSEARLAELESRMAALGPALAGEEVAYDEARHADLRRLIGELEPLAREAARQAGMAERADRLAAPMAEAEQGLSRAEALAARLREELAGLGWSEEGFAEAAAQFRAASGSLQEADVQLARAEAELASAREAEAQVTRRREEREHRLVAIREARRDLLANQELDRAFTDLRTELNAQLRPDLSDLASGFLRDLTTGRYTDLELDEDYQPTILDDGETKTVISGGEEDVSNLALRLAISQMIAERAGQPLSLLILDEIFGSLDEDRRAAVVDLLRSLADRFPQVVLITHIDAVREGFDRVVRVTLDVERGVSMVRDEPPPGAHDAAA